METKADYPFTFTVAAKLAGLTPRTLQHRLDRQQVVMDGWSAPGDGGWRRASLKGVFQLAIAAEIVRYGFNHDFANRLARFVVIDFIGEMDLTDASARESLLNSDLYLRHREEEDGREICVAENELDTNVGSYVRLRPGHILREISGRLSQLGSEDIKRIVTADVVAELGDQALSGVAKRKIKSAMERAS